MKAKTGTSGPRGKNLGYGTARASLGSSTGADSNDKNLAAAVQMTIPECRKAKCSVGGGTLQPWEVSAEAMFPERAKLAADQRMVGVRLSRLPDHEVVQQQRWTTAENGEAKFSWPIRRPGEYEFFMAP